MCVIKNFILYSNKVFFLEASKTNFHFLMDFGEQTWVQRASSINGESEKCLLHRSHGEDGTRDNLPSPGTIISVSPRLTFLLPSSVILEFPAALKLASDLTEVSVLLALKVLRGSLDVVVTAFVVTLLVVGVMILESGALRIVGMEDKLIGVFAVLCEVS